MKLDELKQTWKETKTDKHKNANIMEMLQHKSYGPIAALKREYRKQMAMMALLPFVLILTNVGALESVFTSVMFWSYVAFCLGIIAVSYYNYQTASRMEGMDALVRENLEKQIRLLEMRMKWSVTGVRIVLVYFIILTEVLPYFQHYRMLELWHSLAPIYRFGTYAALLLAQHFVGRKVCQRRFGGHLNYLKELVRDME
jgi:hypothetical protein